LTLQLGQVSEQVNVTSDAPLLETGDASTGQVLDSQKITDLPILGRNTFFMAKLAQSAVFVGNPKFARMQDQNGNSQVLIAGGPVRTNNYMVGGILTSSAIHVRQREPISQCARPRIIQLGSVCIQDILDQRADTGTVPG
jgi:hypothetical protein